VQVGRARGRRIGVSVQTAAQPLVETLAAVAAVAGGSGVMIVVRHGASAFPRT
jgi:hypothetical protein